MQGNRGWSTRTRSPKLRPNWDKTVGNLMPALARGSVCAAALVLLAATPAAAQGTADLFGDRWQVGGFVYVSPSFEGSRSYDAIAFPFIAPAGVGGEGVLQIKGADDLRLRLFQNSGFEFGPLAGYRFGRDGDDVTNVAVGDVDGGLVLGAFATYRTGPLAFSVSYHHQVTGDDTGGLVRFELEHTSKLSRTVKLTAGVGTNYATEEYMMAFFAAPGYAPDAGFKDVYVGATASIDLSDRWSLLLIGRYSHLIGDAADSPIVETESQLYGGLALSYKFGWSR
jgi:outer membrane scaffolding protein for murein synthesis (MipA/OmpV family)